MAEPPQGSSGPCPCRQNACLLEKLCGGLWEPVPVATGLEGRLGSWEPGYLLHLGEGPARWERVRQ